MHKYSSELEFLALKLFPSKPIITPRLFPNSECWLKLLSSNHKKQTWEFLQFEIHQRLFFFTLPPSIFNEKKDACIEAETKNLASNVEKALYLCSLTFRITNCARLAFIIPSCLEEMRLGEKKYLPELNQLRAHTQALWTYHCQRMPGSQKILKGGEFPC